MRGGAKEVARYARRLRLLVNLEKKAALEVKNAHAAVRRQRNALRKDMATLSELI